jgi:hypothetical protein
MIARRGLEVFDLETYRVAFMTTLASAVAAASASAPVHARNARSIGFIGGILEKTAAGYPAAEPKP